jgi:hypothetical protein
MNDDNDTCNHTFARRSNFVDHAVSHFSSQLRPFKCSNCERNFRSRQRLHSHLQQSHPTTITTTTSSPS